MAGRMPALGESTRMSSRRQALVTLAALPALLRASGTARAEEAESAWPAIRASLFGDRQIGDGAGIIALDAPARAVDAAVVPLTIEALVPQTEQRYIKTLYLSIDQNPAPIAGVFHLHPASGKATLSTRVRVNSYTDIHVVAETSDGRLYMVERFVKAAGGCSAPASRGQDQALARLGRMKLRVLRPFQPGAVSTAELLISHPNYTGMQIDQITRNWIPPDYVTKVSVRYAGQPVLEVDGDISIAENPAFTFDFVPKEPGAITVEVADSQGRRFTQAWSIGPGS
jgi:sulfur-oxidizing protein SoxY